MRLVILCIITCFVCSCINNSGEDELPGYRVKAPFVADVDSFINTMPADKMMLVEIPYDLNLRKHMTYQGVALKEHLAHLLQQNGLSAGATDVVFVCKDGYAPVRMASEVLNGPDSYIVFRDINAETDKLWPDSLYKKFAPFYLVWKTDSVRAADLPWPYGLVSLRLVERDSFLISRLSEKKEVNTGYNVFRRHCFSCHAINKTGGQVGPELNVPQNITEYWTDNNIRRYIKDPKSFRYNAHMPAIKNITGDEINAVIQYLHYMKKHKIPSY